MWDTFPHSNVADNPHLVAFSCPLISKVSQPFLRPCLQVESNRYLGDSLRRGDAERRRSTCGNSQQVCTKLWGFLLASLARDWLRLSTGAPTLSSWRDATSPNSSWSLAASEVGLHTSTVMGLDVTSSRSGLCSNTIGKSVITHQADTHSR